MRCRSRSVQTGITSDPVYAALRKTDKERQLADEEGGGGGRGAESHDHKKVWASINYSLLSAPYSSK